MSTSSVVRLMSRRGKRLFGSNPWYSNSSQTTARRRRGGRRGSVDWQRRVDVHTPTPLSWYEALFGEAVNNELLEEQREVERRLRAWSLDRLVGEGYTLMNCHAKFHGRLFDKRIVRFFVRGQMPLHNFNQGDLLTISKRSPLERVDAEGVVYEKRSGFVSAVFDRLPEDLMSVEWRLDKGSNKIAYERMQVAVRRFCGLEHSLPNWLRALVLPTALVHTDVASCPPAEEILELICRNKTVEANSMITGINQEPLTDIGLNTSQIKAVQSGLSRRMSLIQGPPGTGKTWTAVHLIKAWINQNRGGPILATAQSNVAVDQLLSASIKLGLRAVRLGQPVKVTEEFQNRTLDAQLLSHELNSRLESLRQEISDIRQTKPTSGRGIGLRYRDLSVKNRELSEVMETMKKDLIYSAEVVCATAIGAGSEILDNVRFKLIVVDEATQCSEPEVLVPLTRADYDASVVLIGDHQQLPPTVLNQSERSQRVLGVSLFERLAASKEVLAGEGGEISSALACLPAGLNVKADVIGAVKPFFDQMEATMLREQHRMNPWLSMWPSAQFYNGLLVDAVASENRAPPGGIPWRWRNGELVPILFIDSSGPEVVTPDGGSKYNPQEAAVVAKVAKKLLQSVNASEIGVISPYAAQVSRIKSQLIDGSGPTDRIEVKTVDGYQGREKEIIVFSAVRSNQARNIGFLEDPRRLNVALTRAKRGLIVIGDKATLSSNPLWKSWIDFVAAYDLWTTNL